MKVQYIVKLIIVSAVLFTVSCASREMVSEKSLEYLNNKYNEKFRVISIDMNRDEGNWGSAELVVSPENDRTLTFRVVYNYSSEELTWEDYKGAIWDRELGKEAESVIRIGNEELRIKARITSVKSIVLDSMKLPYKKSYMEIIPLIDRPAADFKIDLLFKRDCSEFVWPCKELINAAEYYRDKGFVKVKFTVNLFCGEISDRPRQELRFKLTHGLPLPDVDNIRKLVVNHGESTIDLKIMEYYNDARKLQESGNTDDALHLYLKVIQMNDNPYRFNPYAPVESGYVIESAYYAAGIESDKGNISRAEKLYRLAGERIRFMEVKGDYYQMEKEIIKYLEKE